MLELIKIVYIYVTWVGHSERPKPPAGRKIPQDRKHSEHTYQGERKAPSLPGGSAVNPHCNLDIHIPGNVQERSDDPTGHTLCPDTGRLEPTADFH